MNAKVVTNTISNKLFRVAKELKRAPLPKKIILNRKKKPGYFDSGVASRLPKAYFDWNRPFAQVPNIHWVDPGVDWYKDPETGEFKRTDRCPVPVYYPPESKLGLWGGEGWIVGMRKTRPKKKLGGPKVKKTWRPYVRKVRLYSEILDKQYYLQVTHRVLDLIDDVYGFDFYILKTPREELNSSVGMALKRQMLLQLGEPDTLYPQDPDKRNKILKRYRHFIIPKEEAEWVGLSPGDAVAKQRRIEAETKPDLPLKDVFKQQLLTDLIEEQGVFQIQETVEEEPTSKPFYQRIFRRDKTKDEGTEV